MQCVYQSGGDPELTEDKKGEKTSWSTLAHPRLAPQSTLKHLSYLGFITKRDLGSGSLLPPGTLVKKSKKIPMPFRHPALPSLFSSSSWLLQISPTSSIPTSWQLPGLKHNG